MRRHGALHVWVGIGLAVLVGGVAHSAPVETPPPPEQSPVQLQVQKQGIPTVILYRQLQPQKFRRYQGVVAPLQQTMKATWTYLKLLGDKPPSLQRLAAYNADIQLAWQAMDAKVQPEERSYRSYVLMQQAVDEIRHMTEYAVVSTEAQDTVRLTAKAQAVDAQISVQHRKTLEALLSQLNSLNAAQALLDAEQPY